MGNIPIAKRPMNQNNQQGGQGNLSVPHTFFNKEGRKQ